jgi:hypothetical protein
VASDDDAVLVEQCDGRLPEEPQLAGELSIRIEERGPSPSVLSYEALGRVALVVDVEADVLVLRMAFDEPCVGDRLAVADGSPRRPDVHEDGPAPQGSEREALALERFALELDAAPRGGTGRRARAHRSLIGASAAAGERGEREEEQREAGHGSTVAHGAYATMNAA